MKLNDERYYIISEDACTVNEERVTLFMVTHCVNSLAPHSSNGRMIETEFSVGIYSSQAAIFLLFICGGSVISTLVT
jgi:hypothetical protein